MVYLVMDHLLMVLVLLWSSGLQAEDKHQPTGSQCESTAKADIVLLVCESISISPEEYKIFKSFLNQTVSNFNIGPDKVQIGLVQYGGILENEWQLNTHQTKQSLLEAIAKLRLTKRLCAIGRALNYILRNSFKSEVGMRADSQKIVILITDEESPEYIYPDSRDLRDPSIEVYTIGVKNAKEAQLRAVASDPEEIHMFSVSDYLFLLDITDNLTISLCNSVNNYKLDSVRLVNGTSLCSGRLEVKSEQSWSSVCEAVFDQQDAEVVCRELSCGAPSVLQGALYGEVEAPMWTKEFQCGGHESALLDCGRSDSARSTCSPGKAVGLTCSEHVRLVGGASRCAGTLEVKKGEWRPVKYSDWTLKEAASVCRELDCGFAVSTGSRTETSRTLVWRITSDCVQSAFAMRECASSDYSYSTMKLTCSDSVRLVNGTSLCSGRLEVKSEQSWSSVCEADFDQQDAEVVCRELSCGAPSVLQGALYGEVEAPMWTEEFQCGGNESALLDCGRSDSARSTCSPGKAVGLTCSEHVRLVGGASRCAGTLEVKKGGWRPVKYSDWTLKEAASVCRELDCGFAVSTGSRTETSRTLVWRITSDCVQSAYAMRECASSDYSYSTMKLTCSDSVRLVNGTSLCSGRLEVKSEQSWSSVCEADFDQQDAEVVCRELGCGAPSVLQGALYGEVEAPMWTKEFQCGGHESALLDCGRSDSARSTCSPGKAVGLTCSEPVRLVGGASRCAGTLEVKQGEWRPVAFSFSMVAPHWTLKEAAVICRDLDCGSAVSIAGRNEPPPIFVWKITSDCVQSGSTLRDCALLSYTSSIVELTCSGQQGAEVRPTGEH